MDCADSQQMEVQAKVNGELGIGKWEVGSGKWEFVYDGTRSSSALSRRATGDWRNWFKRGREAAPGHSATQQQRQWHRQPLFSEGKLYRSMTVIIGRQAV